MKISVIIPVKNRANLIGATIRCILAQSAPPFEIIIVDDGSDDKLDDALSEYQHKIILLKNVGQGPGAARNTGLGRATGEAIQFFDSDDLMTSNKLEIQGTLLQESGADFVYGPYVKAVEEGYQWRKTAPIMQYDPLPDEDLSDLVLKGWCLLTQSAMFRTSFLRKLDGWRTDLMPHEDWEYWFRIAKQKPRYVHEHLSCVIYRQHGNQITDSAVKSIARQYDGLKASSLIRQQASTDNSLHSRLISKGHHVYAIRNLNMKLAAVDKIPISFPDQLLMLYFLTWSKVERFRSGTGWMRFHGANNSELLFKDYLRLIN